MRPAWLSCRPALDLRPNDDTPLKPKGAAFTKWRLKRALEYVEAHLAERITLSDLGESATDLSRMYFAARFRANKRVRPREYLLRRRIARAQDLLSKSSMTLVEIALSVGFQTQAYFTTVFSSASWARHRINGGAKTIRRL